MESVVKKYLEYLEAERNYSTHTILSYETDLMCLVQFMKSEGVASFTEVRKEVLRAFLGSLHDQGYSQSSVARKIASIRSFFKYLRKQKIIDHNPSLILITPKVAKKLPSFLDEESMNTLLSNRDRANPRGQRDLAIVELLYSTGIRLNELINLTLNDIQQDQGVLKVKGKGRKERIVPIGRKALSAIKEYLGARKENKSLHSPIDGNSSLFVTEKGKKLYPQAVGRIVRKQIETVSEMEKKSPHVLRHTFATHMLNHGADIRAVKELLGHESLSTTQVYTHVSTTHMKKVYAESHPKA